MIICLAISVEHRLMIDKQIGRHTTMAYAYTVLAWRCAVNNGTLCYDSTVVSPSITFHYHWDPFTFVPPPPVGVFGGGLCRL